MKWRYGDGDMEKQRYGYADGDRYMQMEIWRSGDGNIERWRYGDGDTK